jgi:hypothetical protein
MGDNIKVYLKRDDIDMDCTEGVCGSVVGEALR